MKSYQADQRLKDINLLLNHLRSLVDSNTGIGQFSMVRIAGRYRNRSKTGLQTAVIILKYLELIECLDKKGNRYPTWRVDVTNREVTRTDLDKYYAAVAQQPTKAQLAKQLSTARDRIDELESQIAQSQQDPQN